ncbi:hypothetical protein T07_9082 [Trichinella nelsoni]|uniref:CTCHY-type domain-containing protein n=1 Tax=Trichinella nelsoni TaxID=6336 RepID=A0A0V0RB02_9BILA|nr:hypothetical protein T07_9082 [Trichinella nelsoni]
MGKYFCETCKLFDDDISKRQYHCHGFTLVWKEQCIMTALFALSSYSTQEMMLQ